MAHLVEEGFCAYCTEWAWSFWASLVDLCGPIPSFSSINPGDGQYRLSHPHPGGLCGGLSQHLEVGCTAHFVVAVRLLAGHQALCLAGVVLLLTPSRLILGNTGTRCERGVGGLFGNAGVKEVGRYNVVRDLLSDVQVMLSQTVCTAYIHLPHVICKFLGGQGEVEHERGINVMNPDFATTTGNGSDIYSWISVSAFKY
eukprot:1161888-Pelagomonas_calceolata.AAC.2